MNISAWAIRRPIPSIVLFMILMVAGMYCFGRLGIDENPNIDVPIVTVTITETGAAPSELETQVTRKVEDAIAGIGNIKHITSTVNEGISVTAIEFELGTDSDRAVNDVRDSVTRIRQQLPAQIQEPIIARVDFVGGPFATYTVESASSTVKELSWLIDNQIAREMLSVPGVGQVLRSGGVDREIRVNLDPTRLEALGLTADQVSAQIRALNINLPGGRGEVGSQEESIRTLGSSQTIDALRAARISLPGGGWARLDTLGKVVDGASDPRQRAFLNNQPVVSFSVVRSTGSNLDTVFKAVEAKMVKVREQAGKTLPKDLKITRVRTNADYVKLSYEASLDSLVIGGVLAVIVVWIFLKDWRAAGISFAAMPMSVIPTFAVMQAAGFTLNNMSLLGLALVIGILVDDAIVEIENIVRHIHMGKDPYNAALEAADEIGLAVVATTMTIIVVFVPVAFMGGIPGQFFKQFGLTVAISVFFSLLVARLITPMMAAYWMKSPPEETTRGWLVETYDRLLDWALGYRVPTLLFAGIFFVFSLFLGGIIPKTLLPPVDRGETTLAVELPPGATLDDTTRVARELTRILLEEKVVRAVFATVGSGASQGRNQSAASVNKASLYITLVPRTQRKITQKQFEEQVRTRFTQVAGARLSFGSTMGLSGKLKVVLTSENAHDLSRTAQELIGEMRKLPMLYDVTSSAALQRPEIVIKPDLALAAQQGVSIQSIARTALVATLGDIEQNLAKFDLDERQINIRVQLDPIYRSDLNEIGRLKVAASGGRLIPLSSVAEVTLSQGPSQIDRYDRKRQITIDASMRGNTSLGDAIAAVHDLPAFKNRPDTVQEAPAGDAEIQKDVFGGFQAAMGAAVLFIYAVLVLLFQDFLHPFTIMMALPLSIGGAIIGLLVTGEPLGMYPLIGIVMLMGLTTKNSILLVEYCLTAIHQGTPRTEAIFKAGEARMRPILMTTIAMIAGMVPIALGLGAGSEVRKSMAIAVIGGLVTSTFLTLIVVPVVFTYVDDFRLWLGRRKDPRRRS
ncbi:MAG: multidrug transporter AcrB [Candidatus Xenobia bacterium]